MPFAKKKVNTQTPDVLMPLPWISQQPELEINKQNEKARHRNGKKIFENHDERVNIQKHKKHIQLNGKKQTI